MVTLTQTVTTGSQATEFELFLFFPPKEFAVQKKFVFEKFCFVVVVVERVNLL